MWKLLIIAVLVASLLGCQTVGFTADKDWTAEQKLYKQIKPAVVHINSYYFQKWYIGNSTPILTIVGGRGSGAFISPDGYIVTNAHVVDCTTHDNKTKQNFLTQKLVDVLMNKTGWSKDFTITFLQQAFQRNLIRVSEITTVNNIITPGGEELPFELKEIGTPIGDKEGKDIAIIKVEGRNFPTVRIGNSDKLRPSDHIFVAGYPAGGDLLSLGSEKSQFEMTWSEGTIASEKKASAQGTPILQINAVGVTVGNSGGPVINTEGQMVGLLTFFMRSGGDRGSAYCMASNTVMEFIRKSGANTEESTTDKAYRAGLEFYFAGYYSKALPKFEEVKRLYPKHAGIEDLIADCQTNIASGNDKRYWPDYYPYAAAIALLIITAAIYIIYQRRKHAQAKLDNPAASSKNENKENLDQ